MTLYHWLLTLHLIGAFVGVAALVTLWAIVLATRESKPVLANADAMKIGNVAGPIVGAGFGVALVFGVWLSFQVDGYHLWDGWILGATVLWVVSAGLGVWSGQLFAKNDASLRGKAIALQTAHTIGIVLILILMIWKPGS